MLGGEEFIAGVQAERPMSFIEFTGTARLGRRTKNLVRRLGPDDVAIIDHPDLDRVSAEELARIGRAGSRQRGALAERPLSNPGPCSSSAAACA